MARINEIDERVIKALSGRDKLKALLSGKGFTVGAFAEKYDFWRENVSRCMSGERHMPEIRDALAEELGLPREKIDALIEEERAA